VLCVCVLVIISKAGHTPPSAYAVVCVDVLNSYPEEMATYYDYRTPGPSVRLCRIGRALRHIAVLRRVGLRCAGVVCGMWGGGLRHVRDEISVAGSGRRWARGKVEQRVPIHERHLCVIVLGGLC
jgi:hypothetical protein